MVSSDDKERVAREAGADEVVRSDGEWLSEVKELTGGNGVDLVYDPVGGDRFLNSVRSLAPEGRLLVIGFTEGEIPTVAVNRLLLKNVSVVGVGWGAFVFGRPGRDRRDRPRPGADGRRGLRQADRGRRLHFEDGAQALRDIDERRATGKLVIRVSE